MKRLARSLAVSATLCAVTILPARAEMDVARLKAAIEASIEADYPNSTRSTRNSTPIPNSLSRR